MNFERHKDLKETLVIGRSAIPIVILAMYTSDPSDFILENSGTVNISDKDCQRILESISKGELDVGWENRYYVGKMIKIEPIKNNCFSTTFQIISMVDCMGYYIEFQGKKYLIPVK